VANKNYSKWLINGAPGETVSIHDRGFTYGDGLFETIAVRNSKPRFIDYHMERLLESCRRLGIPYPTGVADEVFDIADGCAFGTVKIILTRGVGTRAYSPPEQTTPTRIIGLIASQPPSRVAYESGITVRFCQANISTNSTLAGIKTLGRLEQVVARSEWQDMRIREGLMCSDDGRVISGTMTNLFFVDDGTLCTPDLARCGINGVMRRVVMEQARLCGLHCDEVDIYAKDLRGMDEIFLTNSLIGIWPVSQLEETTLEIGSITRRLMSALVKVGVAECTS
jgi:4-amino-4-deoxychorismate lyase